MASPEVFKGKYGKIGSADQIRATLLAEGFEIFPWRDAPGAVYAEHSHLHDELIVVTAGGIVFSIEGKDYTLGPGDAFKLPAGTVHSAVNSGSDPVAYFICTR